MPWPDFAEIRERGFYYVDKTRFIPYLERYKAPVFLRPRRFGKSLLVSMLAHYYDRSKSHRFEELFGGTWIGTNPTPEHNQYMIIRYDFSKMVLDENGRPIDIKPYERNTATKMIEDLCSLQTRRLRKSISGGNSRFIPDA